MLKSRYTNDTLVIKHTPHNFQSKNKKDKANTREKTRVHHLLTTTHNNGGDRRPLSNPGEQISPVHHGRREARLRNQQRRGGHPQLRSHGNQRRFAPRYLQLWLRQAFRYSAACCASDYLGERCDCAGAVWDGEDFDDCVDCLSDCQYELH